MIGNNVIVTSVISTIEKELSYSKIRSIFTAKERLQQTITTITSIQEKIPNSHIYIFEGGSKSYEDVFSTFSNITYCYFGGNTFIQFFIHSKNKSLGEIVMLLYGIITQRIFKSSNDFLIKISGRYYINNEFSISKWSNKKLNFRQLGNGYSTKLYAIPYKKFYLYLLYLILCLPLLIIGKSIECSLFYIILKKHVHKLELLGVSGQDGTNGNIMDE